MGQNCILLKGIQDMAFPIIGVVFIPLLMLLASVFLLQNKRRRALVIITGILFLITALYQLLLPLELFWLSVAQVTWKLLTLVTASFLFLFAIRDRQYILSTLSFIQILALILTEILISPNEPAAYLQFDAPGKLLLLTGAFLLAVMLPAVLLLPKFQSTLKAGPSKSFCAGLFLWMAAFAGMLCARSVTGLYLFAQWAFLGNLFLRRAFGEPKNPGVFPILQQAVLTLWIGASGFLYLERGTLEIPELTAGAPTDGLLLAFVILFVFMTGVLVPEKRLTGNTSKRPVSAVGLFLMLFSLLVPFAVLLKFRPLLQGLDQRLTAPAVFLGALVMAANAYHAGAARSYQDFLSHSVLFVSGWGVLSAFTRLEGVFFSVGYIMAATLALAFLFAYMPENDCEKQLDNAPLAPAMRNGIVLVSLLFLLPPFCGALPGLAVMPMLKDYGFSMLFAGMGLVMMSAAVFRRILPLLGMQRSPGGETKPKRGGVGYLRLVLLIGAIVVSLLSEPIYRHLQSQGTAAGLPHAADFAVFADLAWFVRPLGLSAGSVFLGLSLILLVVLYFVSGTGRKEQVQERPAGAIAPYTLTSWLPAGIRFHLWIRAAWITAATLLVGVALSCLKG